MDDRTDPVLGALRARLGEAYGSRLRRLVLFGSRARGNEGSGSDYDVAVFLESFAGFATEARRLAEIEADLLIEKGAVVNAQPFSADGWNSRTGFMAEVRRDGIGF